MPDAPDARPGADFDRELTARAIGAICAGPGGDASSSFADVVGLVNRAPLGVLPAAAPATPRFVPTLPPWEDPVVDGAALDAARRRTKERDVDAIVTAIVERLHAEGYVSRDAGPLDPDRERIGFRRR
jgi:hypothetical protein